MSDLVVPALGESISEAIIAKWLKKVGDSVAQDEPVVDLETDKISVQLPAPAPGILSEQRFAEGTTVKVGDIVGRIAASKVGVTAADALVARAAPTATTAAAPATAAQPTPRGESQIKPATAIATAAAISTPPSNDGNHGNHGQGSVLSPARRRALREQEGQTPPAPSGQSWMSAPLATVAAAAPIPAPTARADREEIVPMTPLRKRIAERLVAAQHTAAVLTTFNEIDMSNLMATRARHQENFVAKHGVKLGFMSFFTKAVVAALQEFPGLNAEVRGTDVVYKKHYDIGIAVGSGRGLVVPVLRDADRLDFGGIEKQIAHLAQKAKDNKLTLEDLSGGTFTVTNGGIYGSMMSTPLLNLPQTGILGMHNITKRAVVVGDAVVVRPMMYVALSYDHRLVDGREAVQFLIAVKDRVENPERMLFGL